MWTTWLQVVFGVVVVLFVSQALQEREVTDRRAARSPAVRRERRWRKRKKIASAVAAGVDAATAEVVARYGRLMREEEARVAASLPEVIARRLEAHAPTIVRMTLDLVPVVDEGERARVEDQAMRELLGMPPASPPRPPKCRVCGCTEEDYRGCVERTGAPCHWVEADLCSACASASDPSKPGWGEDLDDVQGVP